MNLLFWLGSQLDRNQKFIHKLPKALQPPSVLFEIQNHIIKLNSLNRPNLISTAYMNIMMHNSISASGNLVRFFTQLSCGQLYYLGTLFSSLTDGTIYYNCGRYLPNGGLSCFSGCYLVIELLASHARCRCTNIHSVHWGINHPLKHHPSLLPSPPLISKQSKPPFLGNLPLSTLAFCEPLLKSQIFQ